MPVSSIGEAADFYTTQFSFIAEAGDGSTFAVLRSPGGHLLLAADASAIPKDAAELMAQPPVASLLVPFCDSVAERLRARGLAIAHMPQPPWGGARVDFADPFGNRIAMYSLGG